MSKLKAVEPLRSDTEEGAVRAAQEFLEVAEAGGITAYAIIYTDRDGNTASKTGCSNRLTFIGALEAAKMTTWSD